MMKRILLRFVEADKPAYGIHDSILCKAKDADFARAVMTEVYEAEIGSAPVIIEVPPFH